MTCIAFAVEGIPSVTRPTERDDANGVVRTFRAADTGISMAWRWANMIVTLIGCGVIIGTFYTKFNALEASIDRMQASVSIISAAQTDLDKQTDRNTNEVARLAKENEALRSDLADLRSDNRQLLGWLNTMRDMREAYVYDSAKIAQRKLQQQAATPP